MRKLVIRVAAVGAAALPLAGCLSYTEARPAPAQVVVTSPDPAPAPGTVVLRPAY